MGITRQCPHPPINDVAVLLPEAVQVGLLKTPLQEGASIHARGRMPLEEDLVAASGVVLAPEEVIHAHFVEGCSGGISGDVAANTDSRTLGTVHGDRGIPAEQPADLPFQVLVTWIDRLLVGRNRVDVVGADQRGNTDMTFTCPLQQLQHDVAGAVAPTMIDHPIERLQPLGGLPWVGVWEVRRQAIDDRPHLVLDAHVRVLS